ncbi:SYT9 (predicted) [Pycnogonum litorale]
MQQCSKHRQVVRQTTLPAYSARHEKFHRQLSHNIGLETVPFKVCNVTQKDSVGEIKPELYKSELVRQGSNESSLPTAPEQICGSLTFSLRYDMDIEGLVVKVHEARDLPAKDFSGSSDPYVKIYLLPDRRRKFQTKVHRRNLNPTFNETFVFGVTHSELESRKLQFYVFDFDRFSRHDMIGQVTVRNIFENSEYLSEEVNYTMDIIHVPDENLGRGEIMVSLCYLPTAGRLTVTVIKARFLKAMDITGASDPYVKVSLVCQGKRIRKKKTTVKKSTLNPVYNEALVFDVPAENIESVSLMIKVIDYDRIGANELIGCTAVGSSQMGCGREHWLQMLDNPRKPVAQWHSLVDSVPGMPPMTPPPYSIKKFPSFDFGSCTTAAK